MSYVLMDVKKLLGIPAEHEHFDTDILIHINTAVSILRQLGSFQNDNTVDKYTDWDDVLEGTPNSEMIKTYIYMKVRMMFDPPSGAVKEAHKELLSELESRIKYLTDI